ncbi:MAG: hypothetical protein ACK521_05480 [bacterium]
MKALDKATTEGRTIMMELVNAGHSGNFICAKPDRTIFNVDSTQIVP